MRVLRRPADIPADLQGCVVAIGNFDGAHRGHQAIIDIARGVAAPDGRPVVVLTFEPHPRSLFRPDDPPFRLTSLREKIRLLVAHGADAVYAAPFTRAFAALPADQFVDEILGRALRAYGVVVGEDFCFGRGRSGDVRFLAQRGEVFDFTVLATPHLTTPDGERYSSTNIRNHLIDGRPDRAARLLGRPFRISGHVRKGLQLGRTIGFPTANISLGGLLRPRLGVYAVRITDAAGLSLAGVANLGRRPTIDGGATERLEAHGFDWSGDLYGRRLFVDLIAFIRDERRFDGLPALKEQIALDAAEARFILHNAKDHY